MSLAPESALGIDVTDGTLKAVLVSRRGRRLRLVRSWRLPFDGGHDPEAGALSALRAFVQQVRPGTLPRILLSAPDKGHVSRTYLIPTMDADHVGEMVRYELLSEIRRPAEELVVRHHVRRGVAGNQVHVVGLSAARVGDMVERLRRARVPFDDLAPAGFALASFVEHEIPSARDRVVLGVGALTTHLVLLREEGLWTRTLPVGLSRDGEDPAALAQRLAAETEAAVSILLPGDQPFEPADVVLTEEGALSGRLTSALGRAFDLPVRRVAELRRIQVPATVPAGSPSAAETLCMGKAIGLALSGLGAGRFRCPVLGGNPRREAARQLPVAASTLLLPAAGLVVLVALAWQRVDRLESALPASLPGAVASLAQRASQSRAAIERLEAAEESIVDLARRRERTFAVRRLLAAAGDLVSTRGDTVLHLERVWLTAGPPALLAATLHADAALDDELGQRLRTVFGEPFPGVEVRGPEPAPPPGLSRWTLEVALP